MVLFYFFSIISFNQHLLNAHYVPGTATSTWDTSANKIKTLAFMEHIVYKERQKNQKVNDKYNKLLLY